MSSRPGRTEHLIPLIVRYLGLAGALAAALVLGSSIAAESPSAAGFDVTVRGREHCTLSNSFRLFQVKCLRALRLEIATVDEVVKRLRAAGIQRRVMDAWKQRRQ